ncbi:hypothetical protein ScPMuIL_000252 [Solemya velum]
MYPDIDNGHIYPKNCRAKQKIAIVIPYRNRETHLHQWLLNVIPLLRRQQADATIFVSEQAEVENFNRGMMKNIGFIEATKYDQFDCVVFNDVDYVPEDDHNIYQCLPQPNHMAGRPEKKGYKLYYGGFTGGIISFRTDVFKGINGYSNKFFVWGGEDDNLGKRIKKAGLIISRPLYNVSHCTTLRHKVDKRLPLR